MHRLVFVTAVFIVLFVPANAHGALWFLVDRTAAAPNDRVTVRTGATPRAFDLGQRQKPFQRAVRVYLVRADAAADVHSRSDARLHFVATVVPDRNGRGSATFSVPPLDAHAYTLAYWCPACAAYSRGRTFFVQRPEQLAARYRAQALLRVEATQACPVTLPNESRPPRQPRSVGWHGNGLLWAGLERDGTYSVPRERVAADGSTGNKLLWVTTPPWDKPTVSGERIDAEAPPLRASRVNTGSFQNGDFDPSHMSPVSFPTPGCWRLTARLADVSLTYVVRVEIVD